MQNKITQDLMELHLGGMAEQWEAIQMLGKRQDVVTGIEKCSKSGNQSAT